MPILFCPNCKTALTELKGSDLKGHLCLICQGIWLGMIVPEKFPGSFASQWQENEVYTSGAEQLEEELLKAPEIPPAAGLSINDGVIATAKSAFDCLRSLR